MQHTLYSPLMRKFFTIRNSEPRFIVRFCKANEASIDNLSGEEYFAIWAAFADALYEMEDWGYLVGVADEIIHYTIKNNIKFYNGEDIYTKTLFYKAKSYYELYDMPRCEHILQQLLRLKPQSRKYIALRQKCFMRTRPPFIAFLYNSGITFYFVAALAAAFKFIYIEPFAPEYDTYFLSGQLALFCLSGIGMLVAWRLHIRWARQKASSLEDLGDKL